MHPITRNKNALVIVCLAIVLFTLVTVVTLATYAGLGGFAGQRSFGKDGLEVPSSAKKQVNPWLLNLNICPPIICPLQGKVTAENAKEENMPGMNVNEPFMFFEGDIYIVNSTYFYKTAYKRRKGKIIKNDEKTNDSGEVKKRTKRSIKIPMALWEDGVLIYEFSGILKRFPDTMKAIKAAMKHIEEKTCLRFRKRTIEPDYITFMYQPGCWSQVGRFGGQQLLSVGPGCEFMGTVAHEILHAAGFWHEQSRTDRGKYVSVVKENIEKKYLKQFKRFNKDTTTSLKFAYDYESIMHYGENSFSLNNKTTLKVIGRGQELGLKIGQRKHLSAIDIGQIRKLYSCNQRHNQRHSKDRCYKSIDGLGRDYNGDLDYTIGGVTCQQWLTEYPHDSRVLPSSTTELERKELAGHNKCRNPGGKKRRPWCYVLNSKRKWRYCSINICSNKKNT